VCMCVRVCVRVIVCVFGKMDSFYEGVCVCECVDGFIFQVG